MMLRRLRSAALGALALLAAALPLRAAQNTVTPIPGAPLTMAQLATFLNAAFQTMGGCYSGSSAPAVFGGVAVTYQCWFDTTTNPVVLKYYDGASWVTALSLNTSTHAITFDAAQLSGSVTCARMPALTGNVTSSAGSCATTIAAGVVANSMLANMANSTIKCRTTAGTGAPEDCTATQGRSVLGLGTAAVQNTGTSGANIPFLNGANTWATTQTFTVAPVFTDAPGSRTAMGVAIGTNVEAWDADLDAIAALTGTGCLARTASNTWAVRTLTGTANEITVTNGDCVAAAPSFSLPSALTFTGKTITGGTFTGAAFSGVTDVQGAIKYSTQSAPAQITANQNDYNPSSVVCASTATMLINSDAARDITGLAGGVIGCKMVLVNNGSFTITLKDSSGSSSAANRFSFGGDFSLVSNAAIELTYDNTASRWRSVTGSGSGGGGGSVTQVICNGGATTITTSGTCPSRETLTGNRTYYVRTDGNDSNTGLSNSSGAAFLTIAHAVSVTAALDLYTYNVTIQLGNTGTYAGASAGVPFTGSGSVSIQGDTAAPASYIISSALSASGGAQLGVQGMKFVSSGAGLSAVTGGQISVSGTVHFGACGAWHMYAQSGGRIYAGVNYTISGGATSHTYADGLGYINHGGGNTITLTGTPAFGTAFAISVGGQSQHNSTFSGSATGARYSATGNGVVNTIGGGASFLPGNSAGSTSTGGQYL